MVNTVTQTLSREPVHAVAAACTFSCADSLCGKCVTQEFLISNRSAPGLKIYDLTNSLRHQNIFKTNLNAEEMQLISSNSHIHGTKDS